MLIRREKNFSGKVGGGGKKVKARDGNCPAGGRRLFPFAAIINKTHGVDIVEEGRSITPGHFIVARHVGQPQSGAPVERLQAVRKDVHRLVKQGRLNLHTTFSFFRPASKKWFRKSQFYLKDSRPVNDGIIVAGQLDPFHLFEELRHSKVFAVHGPEGRDVDEIVLERLQVERLNVLFVKFNLKRAFFFF